MKTIRYTIRVSPLLFDDPRFTNAVGEDFINKTHEVLTHPNGWIKYGFKFVKLDGMREWDLNDDMYISENEPVHIELCPKDKVYSVCRTNTLSCYVPRLHLVLINFENWMGNSVISNENPPGMTLEEYREYVINHEVGHSLGLLHPLFYSPETKTESQCSPDRSGKKGSVMMQMSRGSNFIAPCLPNSWPLDQSDYDEMQTKVEEPKLPNYEKIRSKGRKENIKTIIILMIIIGTLIIMYRMTVTNKQARSSSILDKVAKSVMNTIKMTVTN